MFYDLILPPLWANWCILQGVVNFDWDSTSCAYMMRNMIVSNREGSTYRCSQFKISNSTKEKGENRIGILESFLFWIIQPRSSLKTVKLATLWARWNHTAGDFKCMSPTFYTSLLNKFHKRNEQTLRKSSLPVVETV